LNAKSKTVLAPPPIRFEEKFGRGQNSDFLMDSAAKNSEREMSDSNKISEEHSAFEDYSPRARNHKNTENQFKRAFDQN
jgi:hypothetical protein